jgi:hypothetical protein
LAAATGAADGLDKAGCATVNLANLDSCDTTLANLKTCLLAEDNARGGEAFSSSYELPPTVCPVRVDSTILAGLGIEGTSRTTLDIGWTSLAHQSDLVDHYVLSSDITCPASPPCGDCTVDGLSTSGPQYSRFLRCQSVTLIDVPCTMPFLAIRRAAAASAATFSGLRCRCHRAGRTPATTTSWPTTSPEP